MPFSIFISEVTTKKYKSIHSGDKNSYIRVLEKIIETNIWLVLLKQTKKCLHVVNLALKIMGGAKWDGKAFYFSS